MELMGSPKQKQIIPPGLIPEFNALGNHPEDMEKYIETHVEAAYERLGISSKYPEAKKILSDAIHQLIEQQTPEFTGHHIPTPETKLVKELLMDTFLNIEKCNFIGKENFDSAIELTKQGNNILIVQNHTSPLDALVPLALMRKNYGELPVSLIMSQVFEYARVTNLMTSGVEKFPVFQPKHIKRFEEKPMVTGKMNRQNVMALRSLSRNAEQGGKMIFLYPERDRNSTAMGVPEPAAMGIPELLSKAGHDLYILPSFVNGLDSVFPNSPGRNEMDDFFEIIKIGQGDFSCGKPIKYSTIIEQVESLSEEQCKELVTKVIGDSPINNKLERKGVIAIILLGLIAKLAPEEKTRGIYNDAEIRNLIETVG